MRALKVHWCDRCGGGHNFGDQLTPALLTYYGLPYQWASAAESELFFVGSILTRLPLSGWKGTVLGSGLIRPGVSRDLSRARVLAVRGPLTRDACHLPPDTPLGDPGLLVDRLLPPSAPRRIYEVGVLPHYVDRGLAGRFPGAQVLDICTPVIPLLTQIAACRQIISSSLHGLIAADALDIPHLWEPCAGVGGGDFKFRDYVGAFGMEIQPHQLRLTPRPLLQERQWTLDRLLRNLCTTSS